MKYNGIDLSQYLKVVTYSGFGVSPPMSLSTFSPTLGAGSYITRNRLPNYNITALVVIETDRNMTRAQKEEYLRTVFVPGTEYVDIVFDERDPSVTYRGIVTSTSLTTDYFSLAEYTLTFTCLPYRYGSGIIITSTTATSNISINNIGTAPLSDLTLTFTVSNTPDILNISLAGTTGVISLIPISDDTLNGQWVIDFAERTITLDGALALQAVSFTNTDFNNFVIAPGSATINFSSEVTNTSIEGTVTYL